MQELIDWYKTTDIQHPVYLAAELHYRSIRIHPFDDGNGRVARLLVNYVLMRHGYTPIIIKSADKEGYLTALQKADAGNRSAFWEYIAEQQVWALELELKAAKGEGIDEPEDIDKEIALLKKEFQQNNITGLNGIQENIYHFMEINIVPLFELIDQRCGELSEFFLRKNRTVNYEITSGRIIQIKEEDNLPDSMKELMKVAKSQKLHFTKAQFTCAFDGLKNSVEQQRIVIVLHVFFEEFNVRVEALPSGTTVRFPYTKTFSGVDIYKLITPEIKEVIKLIKENG